MRHSSMKSIVTALTISVTLLAAAPAASARTSSRQQQTETRQAERDTDRIAAVRQFINRTIRRIAVQGGIGVPIPKTIEPENP